MGNSGIIKRLDDLCKLPQTTNASLIENFNKEFSSNPHYIPSKRSDLSFTIIHYAGKVTYTCEDFLEKNRDSLPVKITELLPNSSNQILRKIFFQGIINTQLKHIIMFSSFIYFIFFKLLTILKQLAILFIRWY